MHWTTRGQPTCGLPNRAVERIIITHDPGVERTSYVVRQFIVLPYWRHHLLRLTIAYTLHTLPHEITNQPYRGLLFSKHTLSYLLYPSLYRCPTFTTHILLYPIIPCILYTNHIYTLPYLTLSCLTVPYIPYIFYLKHNHTTLPTTDIPFSILHILYPIIYPTLLYTNYTLSNLNSKPYPTYTNPNTNTYLTLP